ncbi:hypothetical protein CPB86DRAFT_777966 [Serendipita vermifera]|nr:hypothetical protein CPB86DRAFT_777966 [Serendipita vermifera]
MPSVLWETWQLSQIFQSQDPQTTSVIKGLGFSAGSKLVCTHLMQSEYCTLRQRVHIDKSPGSGSTPSIKLRGARLQVVFGQAKVLWKEFEPFLR